MKILQMLLVLIPIIQAVKVKVARENEKSIVNINANKGPVLYPSAAKQIMAASSNATSTTTGKPPNSTFVYQKGFLPIPMATVETTTTRQHQQKQQQPAQQHERRTGFSTASQEIDEQIPSTPEVKLANYEINEHHDSYEGSYKGQIPIHTHLFSPETPFSDTTHPPYKFESVGIENQLENNEINHYQYGDFKGYNLQEHQIPEHHIQGHHIPEQHLQGHHIPEEHIPKNEHKEQTHQES